MTRDELAEHLAEVSHRTWMRQHLADPEKAAREPNPDPAVTHHDRERAEDTVAALELLGILRAPAATEPRPATSDVHHLEVTGRTWDELMATAIPLSSIMPITVTLTGDCHLVVYELLPDDTLGREVTRVSAVVPVDDGI